MTPAVGDLRRDMLSDAGSMNLLLLTAADLADGAARPRISGRRSAHLLDILGVTVGSTVTAGLLGGRMGHATVIAIRGREVELDLCFDRDPPPRFDVRLVLALPRPKGLRRILQGCAAIGVRSIHLINSWRVEKSYWGSPLLDPRRLEAELVLGAEQGRDTILPEVELHKLFKPFVEDQLGPIGEGTSKLLGEAAAPEICPTAVSQPVTLVIGPEGGLIPYEIEAIQSVGFRPVHLGPRALRVEQAVPAFLGRLIG